MKNEDFHDNRRKAGWRRAGGMMLLLMLCLLPFVSGKAEEKDEYLDVYYFYNNPCETCYEVENFAAEVRESFGTGGAPFHYNVIGYYVYGTEGAAKVKEIKEHFGISDQEIFYPMAVAGEHYLLGDERIKNGIREMMEEAWEESVSGAAGDSGSAEQSGENDPGPEAVSGERESDADETAFEETEPDVSGAKEILLRYFDTAACESCAKTDELVENLSSTTVIGGEVYHLRTETCSVAEGDNAELLTGLFEAYQVPEKEQRVPILFVGSRYLSGEKAIAKGLDGLL